MNKRISKNNIVPGVTDDRKHRERISQCKYTIHISQYVIRDLNGTYFKRKLKSKYEHFQWLCTKGPPLSRHCGRSEEKKTDRTQYILPEVNVFLSLANFLKANPIEMFFLFLSDYLKTSLVQVSDDIKCFCCGTSYCHFCFSDQIS